MTIRAAYNKITLFLLAMLFFTSPVLSSYASAGGSQVEKVIIDNAVVTPEKDVLIPRMPEKDFSEEGKTAEEIATYNYNKENFITVLNKSDCQISDAYWMYRTAGSDGEFEPVPDSDISFSDIYEYKLRVVLESEKDFNVEKRNLLVYKNYSSSEPKGKDDMNLFETKQYSDPGNEIDVNPKKMRFDIIYAEQVVSPYAPLAQAYSENCTANGRKDGKIHKVTDVMEISGGNLKEPVVGTEEGITILNLAPSTYKVASVYNPNVFLKLDVKDGASATIQTLDVVFEDKYCGYTPGVNDIYVKNTSSVPTMICKVEMSTKSGNSYFNASTGVNPNDTSTWVPVGAGEEKVVGTISPVEGLHGDTFQQNICVSYLPSAEADKTTAPVAEGQAKITVHHLYNSKQGGWCTECDAYKADFVGRIVSGSGRTYYINFWPMFNVNLMYGHLDSVLVDDVTLTRGVNYSDALDDSGYTKITLQNSFIRTLQPGRHTIKFVFKDSKNNTHTAEGFFRLSSATGVYTGDENDIGRMAIIMMSAILGIWSLIFASVKKRFRDMN